MGLGSFPLWKSRFFQQKVRGRQALQVAQCGSPLQYQWPSEPGTSPPHAPVGGDGHSCDNSNKSF